MSDIIELDDEEFIGTIRTEVTAEDSAAIVDFIRDTPVGIASAKQGRDISEVYSLQATTPIYKMDAITADRENVLGRATPTGEFPIYPTRPAIIDPNLRDLTGGGTEDDPYTYSDAMKLIERKYKPLVDTTDYDVGNYLKKIEIIPKEVYPERSQASAQDISPYIGAQKDFYIPNKGISKGVKPSFLRSYRTTLGHEVTHGLVFNVYKNEMPYANDETITNLVSSVLNRRNYDDMTDDEINSNEAYFANAMQSLRKNYERYDRMDKSKDKYWNLKNKKMLKKRSTSTKDKSVKVKNVSEIKPAKVDEKKLLDKATKDWAETTTGNTDKLMDKMLLNEDPFGTSWDMADLPDVKYKPDYVPL